MFFHDVILWVPNVPGMMGYIHLLLLLYELYDPLYDIVICKSGSGSQGPPRLSTTQVMGVCAGG